VSDAKVTKEIAYTSGPVSLTFRYVDGELDQIRIYKNGNQRDDTTGSCTIAAADAQGVINAFRTESIRDER
jgi:hypothetical protein